MNTATIQSVPGNQDHHHHTPEELLLERLKHSVAEQIGGVLNDPNFVGSMMGLTMEAIGNALIQSGAARRPLRREEFIVPPFKYNSKGDCVGILPRRFFDKHHAFNLLLNYTESEGRVGFSYTLFQEDLTQLSNTRFCQPEPELRAAIEKAISGYYKPEMAGCSAMWTVLVMPASMASQLNLTDVEVSQDQYNVEVPQVPAPTTAPAPAAPVEHARHTPPQVVNNLNEAGTLDDMFAPVTL